MKLQARWMYAGVVAVALTLTEGCKKDENPVGQTSTPITESNLFPLATGRTVVYSEYDLDTTTARKVDATVHRRVTCVGPNVMHNNKSAFQVVDSIYTPDGAVQSVDTSYMAIENGDLYADFDNAWSVLFKRSAGTNVWYDVRTYTDSSTGFKVTVQVTASISAKEDVVTGGGTFQAYKLTLKGTIAGATIEFPVYYYFADGVGPVKQTTPVSQNPLTGQKMKGEEMVMVSKSF